MWENLVKPVKNLTPGQEHTDVHEARKVLSTGKSKAIEPGHEQSQSHARPHSQEKKEPRVLKCPVCSVEMNIRKIGQVEVDECPDCGGLFLDRGELRQLQVSQSSFVEKGYEEELLIYTPHGLSHHINRTG